MNGFSALGRLTPKLRQRLVQAAWLAQAVLVLFLLISGMPAYLDLLRTPCEGNGCAYFQLSQASAEALAQAGVAPHVYANYLAALTLGTLAIIWSLAAIIFWRSTVHWMAAYLSFGLIALSPTFFFVLTIALVQQQPGWRWPAGLLQGISVWVLLTFGFLFPSGHFVPPWTRPFAYVVALTVSGMLLFSSLQGMIQADQPAGFALLFMLLVTMLASAVAQVYRYRRVSGPVERQQAKWVVFGFVLFMSNTVLFVLAGTLPLFRRPGLSNALYYLVGGTVNVLMCLVLLSCVAVSILRYRLWDIDVIIRRTLVYALLTALLALTYLGSVLVLQSLFGMLTGQRQSTLVTVLSTLVIAALFVPLRAGVQRAIDQRFFRRKYDAVLTLAAFAAGARDEIGLEQLSARLLEVVQATMQPAHVGLWLKAPPVHFHALEDRLT